MSDTEESESIPRLHQLGTMDRVPIGTRVYVEEDGFIYIGVGNTSSQMARRLGWTQANIWMPEHVESSILLKHRVFPNPVVSAQVVLTNPSSVHNDRRGPGFIYFFVTAERLREAELLTSRSTDFVDGVVELRHVSGGQVLRFFHLAPVDRNKGGRQIWP